MKTLEKILLTCVGLLCLGVSVAAMQEEACPVIVQSALETTNEACQETGRNQACYGNLDLEAEPRPGVEALTFSEPGDRVDLVDVLALRLSSLDAQNETWGVALMRVQANLPDTLPGQNVTMVLFGDVEIENAVETQAEPATLEVTAAGNANVRGGPSTNDAVVTALAAGDSVTANGRLEDSSWLRITLPEEEGQGWVFAELVTSEGDFSTLDVVEAGDSVAPQSGPMQAFYFRTGIGDAPCAEAPDSGILIQTPEGAAEISLTVNEVNITLGSTVYVQAQADGELVVNAIERQARVEAQGEAQVAIAGTRVRVPLDDELRASGPPSEPEPYDEQQMQALPVSLLERAVTIPAALTAEEIEAALVGTLPTEGEWTLTFLTGECRGAPTTVTLTLEDGRLCSAGGCSELSTEPGVYVFDMSDTDDTSRTTYRVVSPDRIEVELFVEMAPPLECTGELTLGGVEEGQSSSSPGG